MKLNPALKPFWRTKADTRVLKGGRASTKTWDAAGIAVFMSSQFKLKFLCMRQFQNKIQESVYSILCLRIEQFKMQDEFEILKTSIVHKGTGSSFHFYGIHRNITEIKGFEGADVGWIEEAEGLTKEQWSVIEPTLRKEGAQAWIIYNPKFVNDYVETHFKHDPANGVIVRHINYNENRFLSDTMRRKIQRLKDTDFEEYEHIYLGIPLTDDDRVIIKLSWIEASIDAHIKLKLEPTGKSRIGYDVADDGADMNATVETKGFLTIDAQEWKGGEDELQESCRRVYNQASKTKALITYDSIGVGAGSGSNFKAMNIAKFGEGRENAKDYINYQGFNAGSGVKNPDKYYGDPDDKIKNKDHFSNAKAQEWWRIADMFRNTYNAVNGKPYDTDNIIAISSKCQHLDKLKTELSTPRRNFDTSGKVKVESKKDLSARDVKSPNLADAFIEAYMNEAESTGHSGVYVPSRKRAR
jgi:phage terminase large subunit